MRAFHSDRFVIPLPAGHRFPITKYALLRERVVALGDPRVELAAAPAAMRDTLLAAHTADWVDRVLEGRLTDAEVRRIGFPWSPALVERSRRSVGATLAAFTAARSDGVAVSLAGGTHHAGAAGGAGFCVFNDVATAALAARRDEPALRVLVVDCDVHQGDGTARLLAGTDTLHAFSLHAARNYPHHKAVSDLDVALPDGTGDEAYLDALELGLELAFARARPDVVIYLAGADAFAGDRLGRLAVSKAGLARRDALVLARAAAAGAPAAIVMGGGYADPIDDAVDVHLATVRAAADAVGARPRGLAAGRT